MIWAAETGKRIGGEIFKQFAPVFSLGGACVPFKIVSFCYVWFILYFYTLLIWWSPAKIECQNAKRKRGSVGAF